MTIFNKNHKSSMVLPDSIIKSLANN